MNCPHCTNGVVSVDEDDMIVLGACGECSGYGVIEKSLQVSEDKSEDLVAVAPALCEFLLKNQETTPDVHWTVPPWRELHLDHTRPISHAEWVAGYREWKAKTQS
jgi:hypothetical protein